MLEIKLSDIIELQWLYVQIFDEEDAFPVDRRIVRKFKARQDKILNSITKEYELQYYILDVIEHGSWNREDITFKPICDKLREKGFDIIK